jgi:predicted DNA-binding ribbon-helix-helix protein
MKSPVVKRSILIAGRRTSVSLEDDFWRALKQIAAERNSSVSELIGAIAAGRTQPNLSSTLRLFVLGFYRDQIAEFERRGHTRAMLAGAGTPRTKQGH